MDDLKRRIKEAEDRVKGADARVAAADAARKRAEVCVSQCHCSVWAHCGRRGGVVGLRLTESRATRPACRNVSTNPSLCLFCACVPLCATGGGCPQGCRGACCMPQCGVAFVVLLLTGPPSSFFPVKPVTPAPRRHALTPPSPPLPSPSLASVCMCECVMCARACWCVLHDAAAVRAVEDAAAGAVA